MGFEMPTNMYLSEFEKDVIGKSYDKVEDTKPRVFRNTQNNVVIPTKDLIGIKSSDLRVLACISAISNVSDCTKIGGNTRYVDVRKVNKSIEKISAHLRLSPKKVKEEVNKMLEVQSEELKLVPYEIGNEDVYVLEINYVKGGFILLPYDLFEQISGEVSNRAFKIYCCLRWLCYNFDIDMFEERIVAQEYLLQQIGLSSNSKKAIRDITEELVDYGLINIRKGYVHEHNIMGNGVTKEVMYYSIVE